MLVLTFKIGEDHHLALDIRQVREVVPRVRLDSVVAGPPWLAGMFVYRGMVVPVIDLHRLMGSGECPTHLSSRIILVPIKRDGGSEGLLGLLAAQVADIRDLPADTRHPAGAGNALGQPLADGGKIIHLIDLNRLLSDPVKQLLPLS
ncbi:MAG: chemotaxis protein CheW [Gemmataceae bacterium]